MFSLKYFTLLGLFWIGLCMGKRSERLVLHSDDEVANAITTLQAEVGALKSELNTIKTTGVLAQGGSTYTRWGRTSCPGNGTELVYKGYMAGAQWDQAGGGANHLCLPDNPTWGQYVEGTASGSTIEGTEIELSDNIASSLFGKTVTNQDVPCAVCKSQLNSQGMIPARSTCYPGWTMEYSGYLASSGNSWASNLDYICLDSGLEFLPQGMGNDDQHVLNIVEAHCGSLACPPYYEGRELACVVCTK